MNWYVRFKDSGVIWGPMTEHESIFRNGNRPDAERFNEDDIAIKEGKIPYMVRAYGDFSFSEMGSVYPRSVRCNHCGHEMPHNNFYGVCLNCNAGFSSRSNDSDVVIVPDLQESCNRLSSLMKDVLSFQERSCNDRRQINRLEDALCKLHTNVGHISLALKRNNMWVGTN